jgi:signal transduction histidine kinase
VRRIDAVELFVRDDGVGMDDATRTQIFEPFFTTRSTSGGTGLGLSTVYGIVRDRGGTIAVESKPGAGSIIRVVLPLSRELHQKTPAAPRDRCHDAEPVGHRSRRSPP